MVVIGLSSRVREFNSQVDIKLLNDKGETTHVDLLPHKSKKPIASAWSFIINEIPSSPVSLSISMKDPKKLLFRDFFVHLNFQKSTFELPEAEVWVKEEVLIGNLAKVLSSDIKNIKELINFEKGLRFAVQKLKELIQLNFEYLANPYYLQREQLDPTNDIADEITKLTEELERIDGKSHCGLHQKELKSFGNIKFRWEKVMESGDLRLMQWSPKPGQ